MDLGDGGNSETWCESGASFLNGIIGTIFPLVQGLLDLKDCNGHAGDSEFILLDVSYNATTKHWFLADAKYSAHTWHVDFAQRASDSALYVDPSSDGGGSGYPRNYLEYPDGKVGGYPRAWVANRKHANYPTQAYCDGPGGLGGADECYLPRYLTRLEVAASANIGSRTSPFINCVPTSRTDHPAYGQGVQECYWSMGATFTGWFNTSDGGLPYGALLATHFGF